ncbi:MAG TPA: hypothetical protein ENG40_02260 [Thermoprotei archaeon]|nr:hypothetical protein [Thermoprotei archaeon]
MEKILIIVIIAIIIGGVLVYSLWLRINYRETWKITETPSTYIVKTPSIDDFVSIGITYKLNDNGLLTYTSDPY